MDEDTPCPACDGDGDQLLYGIPSPCVRCNGTGRYAEVYRNAGQLRDDNEKLRATADRQSVEVAYWKRQANAWKINADAYASKLVTSEGGRSRSRVYDLENLLEQIAELIQESGLLGGKRP